MKPTRSRLPLPLSPLAVIRALLDFSLIGSWIWLASGSLPQPIPALGAALFGAASAGYWAMSSGIQSPQTEEDREPTREEKTQRLIKFTSRPVKGPSAPIGEWFNDPSLGNRLRTEAERCEELGIPMSVIFVRTQPNPLTDWSEGAAPRTLPEVLTQVLDGSRQKYVCGANDREALIAFSGGDRPAAEDLMKRLFRHLNSGESEAGIVVHPEEGIEPAALASVAKLRLQPLRNSSSSSRSEGVSAFDPDSQGAIPPSNAKVPPWDPDDSETAVG